MTALAVATWCSAAWADTGDVNYTIAPLYVTVDMPGAPRIGAGAAADVEYGLTEELYARLTAVGSGSPYPFAHDATSFAGLDAGVTYDLDILRVIPFFTLGGAAMYSGGHAGQGMALGVEIGAGFDDLRSRTFSWGVEARYHFLVTGPSATSGLTAIPAYFYLGPRITLRFPDI